TDVAWINGLMHVIIAEGLWDKQYVDERTEGFEELRAAVASYTPERVQQITGIPADDLRKAARMYAQAPRAMVLYAMGITQHITGTDNVKSLANLTMLCGNIGIEGGGLNPLRGQNNVQGACDMGALPNVLPGYQPVTDEAALTRFQQGWSTGVRLSNRAGLTLTEMVPGILEGKVKGMFVMGENPVISDPNTHHVREALESLDLLVVQDIFFTETAALADVVLPAASFAEKDGTFTNTERRVQRVRQAVNPPGNALPDWQILCALAERVRQKLEALHLENNGGRVADRGPTYGFWGYRTPSEIFEESASLVPSYAGISYERLERGGIQWPCPTKYHPGTPFLHKGRFTRGLGKFHAIEFQPPAELPDDEYPLYLSTGRIRYHYHTGTMTRRSKGLSLVAPEERIEVHPIDAEALGLADGDWAKVISRRGEVRARVRLTERSAPGLVFGTFHFKEVPINELTNNTLDPVGKIPALKVTAVRLERDRADQPVAQSEPTKMMER
ncbi:MAG: molybdopterin-dependent oxidoreductase, partial [Chloroflexi bacterium]|nr:molybdopterin-dependent oxidoreductase [Chloroflexota bacterium]